MSLKLWEYLGEKVKVIYNDGEVYEGKVVHFDDEDDNADGYDSISLVADGLTIDISESEIKSIKEIE